jgi:hypothetical protein
MQIKNRQEKPLHNSSKKTLAERTKHEVEGEKKRTQILNLLVTHIGHVVSIKRGNLHSLGLVRTTGVTTERHTGI